MVRGALRVNRITVRSEVFLREDIKNMLRAIDGANQGLAAHLPVHDVTIYRAGFAAALQAVATAFDVRLDAASEYASYSNNW
jgi:hypothetical protein